MDGYFGYMKVHDYKHVCTTMHECAHILIGSRRAKSTLDLLIVAKNTAWSLDCRSGTALTAWFHFDLGRRQISRWLYTPWGTTYTYVNIMYIPEWPRLVSDPGSLQWTPQSHQALQVSRKRNSKPWRLSADLPTSPFPLWWENVSREMLKTVAFNCAWTGTTQHT